MTRIKDTFAALKRPALVTFTMAGDPDAASSLELLLSLPSAGADIIELGMPFSDPMADGQQIAAAGGRALKNGACMKQTLDMVVKFREQNKATPIILMGYANPVLAYDDFCNVAAKAGVDGLIIVDMPPEEEGEFGKSARANNLDLIRFASPTTSEDRMKTTLKDARGFVYYVSITGITGAKKANLDDTSKNIAKIKKHTNAPIAVGFGVKTPSDASAMSKSGADAIVVGSSIVQTAHEQGNDAAIKIVKGLSKAIK